MQDISGNIWGGSDILGDSVEFSEGDGKESGNVYCLYFSLIPLLQPKALGNFKYD